MTSLRTQVQEDASPLLLRFRNLCILNNRSVIACLPRFVKAVPPIPSSKINSLICYETPSSTDWGNDYFKPNFFVDISKGLDRKIKAFKQYKNEISNYPHPRSTESLKNRASYWGSKVGIKYAESFIKLREINK